jgi:hypothetical protein
MSSQPSAAAGQSVVCPVCRGAKVLGQPPRCQICPKCNGTGLNEQNPIRVPFDVVLPNVVLTALQQNVNGQQQLDADADFEWIELVSSQTGIYSVTLRDTSTGRLLSNNPVNSENFAGTAQLPHVLVEPYIYPRATTILGVFNDRSNSGNTVQLVLRGYKLFPRNNPAQGSQGAIVQA